MSKVSIIVPCYKLGKYLPEALDSVLAQDYADWECIIVNDGSPDSTAEVADSYCAKDTRFKSLDLENGGVIRARNKGVEASTGDYLLFLDADDILFPDYIGKAVRAMEENPALLVVSGPVEQFGDASGMIEIPPFSKDTMLARNSLHVSSMIRRADFDRAGGFNPENVADKLRYLLTNDEVGDFWIDMESGVRTDDWFDLDKVRRVLAICNEVIRDLHIEEDV